MHDECKSQDLVNGTEGGVSKVALNHRREKLDGTGKIKRNHDPIFNISKISAYNFLNHDM